MAWEVLGLFLACACAAEVIGTMAGFGAATILTPIAMLFFDAKTAIALVACFHLFGTGSRLVFFGRHIDWRTWRYYGLTAVGCAFLGALVMATLPSNAVKLVFGVFLLTYVGLSLTAAHRVQLPRTRTTLVGGGVLGGAIAGALGTGGAIRSACLLAFGLERDVYIGTSAAIAVMVDAARLPVYVAEGFLPSRLAVVAAALIAAAFLGAWIGQRLVRLIEPELFRKFVLVMLALFGLKLAWEGWHGLA